MSSRKNNLLFVLLIIVTIFAIVIVDANNYSNTEQSIPESNPVSSQTQAPCGQSSGGCQSSSDSNSNNAGGSCCATGGAESSVNDVESAALAYYANTYGDSDVTIKVNDYGCHQEIEVIKDGNIVMMLGYNGEVYEL